MAQAKQVHLLVTGRVQGVSFRYYTAQTGRELGLTGWVRNLPDGRVEAVACGEKELLERFVDYCRQGPPLARVDDLDFNWSDAVEDFSGFSIRY